MGVLQDFERRLEGAVEGFFARTFRSGLHPIELAKALQRYAEDTQHVTDGGVVVPNVFRFEVNPKDVQRLDTFGDSLARELASVVVQTATERGWKLRGPALVQIRPDEGVKYGMYELAGRVEVVDTEGKEAHDQPPAPPQPDVQSGYALRLANGDDAGREVRLTRGRVVAGRLDTSDVPLDDPTVSRQHAAFVRRADQWWVVDLGSTNGTKVNGVRASEHPLEPGDRLELGEAALEFVEV